MNVYAMSENVLVYEGVLPPYLSSRACMYVRGVIFDSTHVQRQEHNCAIHCIRPGSNLEGD